MNKSREGYLTRTAEGRYWKQTAEKDGVIFVSVHNNHNGKTKVGKIRKCDYDRKECYPLYIPYYRLEVDI